jgi:hypothetical protein
VAVWLRKTGRNPGFVLLPFVFMTKVSVHAVVSLILQNRLSMTASGGARWLATIRIVLGA